MKAKAFLFIAFLFLQGHFSFAQCISIELSITWEMGYHALYKDSIINIPKLNIIYRNNCDANYYFLKVYDDRDSLPSFICTRVFYPTEEKYDCHKTIKYNHKRYKDQNFNVAIGHSNMYGSSWEAYDDTTDFSKREYPDLINCTLDPLCKCISNSFNQGQLKWQFEPSDVLSENILDSVKNRFVFLKSREIYTDTYNLAAFQIIEGCYTFLLYENNIKSYVLSSETIFTDKRWVITPSGETTVKTIWHELELPPLVGEYHRYSGAFNTNKVTVCFGDQ